MNRAPPRLPKTPRMVKRSDSEERLKTQLGRRSMTLITNSQSTLSQNQSQSQVSIRRQRMSRHALMDPSNPSLESFLFHIDENEEGTQANDDWTKYQFSTAQQGQQEDNSDGDEITFATFTVEKDDVVVTSFRSSKRSLKDLIAVEEAGQISLADFSEDTSLHGIPRNIIIGAVPSQITFQPESLQPTAPLSDHHAAEDSHSDEEDDEVTDMQHIIQDLRSTLQKMDSNHNDQQSEDSHTAEMEFSDRRSWHVTNHSSLLGDVSERTYFTRRRRERRRSSGSKGSNKKNRGSWLQKLGRSQLMVTIQKSSRQLLKGSSNHSKGSRSSNVRQPSQTFTIEDSLQTYTTVPNTVGYEI